MRTIFAFVIVTLIVVIHTGCGLRVLEQSQESITSAEPQESLFIILNTADVKNPTLAGSVQLPFRVGPDNSVTLSAEYAYITTAEHLHVVDLSDWQQPARVAAMPFPDKVGNAKLSGHRLFVAGQREIYIVDVSNPNHPSLQATTRTLTPLGQIKTFDVHETHLYVLDKHYLHIFNVATEEPRFVESMAVSPSRLLGIRAEGESVQLILPKSSYFSPKIWREVLDRQNLLELSARYKKLRVSEDYLLFADHAYPTRVITITRENHQGWFPGQFEHYDMEANYLDYLQSMENEQHNRQEATDVYVSSKGILVNNIDGWRHPIDTEMNSLGPITDFQISGDFLYVSNLNGFLSIIDLFTTKRPFQRGSDRFLSATALKGVHPIGVAVGENYTGVLCNSTDLK